MNTPDLLIHGFRRDYYAPDIAAHVHARHPVLLLGARQEGANMKDLWSQLSIEITEFHRMTPQPVFHRLQETRVLKQHPMDPPMLKVLKNTFQHLWMKGTLLNEIARCVATFSLGTTLLGGTIGGSAWMIGNQVKQLRNGTHILLTVPVNSHRIFVRLAVKLGPLLAIPVLLTLGTLIWGGAALCRRAFMSQHEGSFRTTYLRITETYQNPWLALAHMTYETVPTATLDLNKVQNEKVGRCFKDPLSDELIDPKDIQTPRVMQIGNYLVKTEKAYAHFKAAAQSELWFAPENRDLNPNETQDVVFHIASYFGKFTNDIEQEITPIQLEEAEDPERVQSEEASGDTESVQSEERSEDAESVHNEDAPPADPLEEGLAILNEDQETP